MICAASSWRLCGSVVDRFSRSMRAPPYPRPTPVLPPSARVTGPRSRSGGPSRLRTVLAISGRGPDDQLGDQFGGQLIGVGHRHVARIGNDGLAGRVDEVQRAALVGLLKLLPVKEDPVGQPVDAPSARRLHQLDRAGVGQRTLTGLEHADVRKRAEDVGAHGHRNPVGTASFDEDDAVDQQCATRVVPPVRRRLGEELSRGEMPVGGSAVALRNSRSSTSGSIPGVGFGRLGGAGRSTVPIACGADELGTPAHPASITTIAHADATAAHVRSTVREQARLTRSPPPVRVPGPNDATCVAVQPVSAAADSSSPCGRGPAAA